MSRHSAYRVRARADSLSFARAWDYVLTPPGSGRVPSAKVDWRKVTNRALIEQLDSGFVQPLIYRGKIAVIRRRPDKSALLRLLRRFDNAHAHAHGAKRRRE